MSIKRFGTRLAPWLVACALSVSFSAVAADQDSDGIDDAVETAVGLDPAVANSALWVLDDGTGTQTFFNPSVAVDSEGRLHIAALSLDTATISNDNLREIYYMLVAADGEVLIAPTQVNTPDAVGESFPHIDVTSDDRAIIVWAGRNGPVSMVTIDPAGDDLNGDAAVPADILDLTETAIGVNTSGGGIAAHVNSRDEVVVVSNKGNVLRVLIADAAGVIVVAETTIGSAENDHLPRFDFDSNDNVHVIFQDQADAGADGSASYMMLNGTTGAVMIDATSIYDERALTPRSSHFGLHVDADDIVHVVFGDKRNTIDADEDCHQCFQSGQLFYTQLDPSLDDQNGDKATEGGTNATGISIKLMDDVFLADGWYSVAFVDSNDLFIVLPGSAGKAGQSAMAVDLEGNIVAPLRVMKSHRASAMWRWKLASISGEWAVWADNVATATGGTYRLIASKTLDMIGRGVSGAATVQTSTGAVAHFDATDESGLPDGAMDGFPTDEFEATGTFWRTVVSQLDVGGSVSLTIDTGADLPENFSVIKFDGSDWFEIGASKVNDTSFAVTLVDGGLGDADGVANGMIVDPIALATPVVVEPAAPVSISGGGGGGCVIGDENRPLDPLFPALLALAGAYFIRRRMTN